MSLHIELYLLPNVLIIIISSRYSPTELLDVLGISDVSTLNVDKIIEKVKHLDPKFQDDNFKDIVNFVLNSLNKLNEQNATKKFSVKKLSDELILLLDLETIFKRELEKAKQAIRELLR